MSTTAPLASVPPISITHGRFRLWQCIFYTKAGLSTLVFVAVMFISLAAEPPFLMVRPVTPIEEQKISYPRCLFVSLAAAALVYRLPVECRREMLQRHGAPPPS